MLTILQILYIQHLIFMNIGNYKCTLFNLIHFGYYEQCFKFYSRGMHFENVSVLINSLMEIIAEMGYCWRDPQGYICRQNGVFRVNCIDCLDRTNVVQVGFSD